MNDRAVPSYAEQEGVDPARRTETFAEVIVEVNAWRWAGVPFRLRTGKALRGLSRACRSRGLLPSALSGADYGSLGVAAQGFCRVRDGMVW